MAQSDIKPITVTFKIGEEMVYDMIVSHGRSVYLKECVLLREKMQQEIMDLKFKIMFYESIGGMNVNMGIDRNVYVNKSVDDVCCDIGGI